MSVHDLEPLFQFFDVVWILANHRLRKPASGAVGLAASNIAARYVRSALEGLLSAVSNKDGVETINSLRKAKVYGLVGAVPYVTTEAPVRAISSALLSTLNEDVPVQSAQETIALWPGTSGLNGERINMKLAGHRLSVRVIDVAPFSSQRDIVTLSLGVRPEKGPEAFREFLAILLWSHGWRLRDKGDDVMLFESEGESLAIGVARSRPEVARLGAVRYPLDVIVTNCSIDEALKTALSEIGRPVIHFSQWDEWSRGHFGDSFETEEFY